MPDTDNQRGEIPREVDDAMLARILRCDEASIRKYARARIINREKNRKFALFQSIGAVIEHLRAVAGHQPTGDAMKAGAALKDAQRRLVEVKLAKLEGQLLSMPEIEALWGDMAAASKWLYLTIPARARALFNCSLAAEHEAQLSALTIEMLRAVAFAGPLQLPSRDPESSDDDDDDDEPARR